MTLTTERQQFEQWWHEEYCHLEGSSEAAFVKHVAWEAMLKARELLANRGAQPVAWTVGGFATHDKKWAERRSAEDNLLLEPLYRHPVVTGIDENHYDPELEPGLYVAEIMTKGGAAVINGYYTAPPAPAVNAAPDFEAWFVEKYKQPERLMKNGDGAYKFSGVQMAFSAWVDGRAAMLAQPVSQHYTLPKGWIACSERMPDADGAYWCWFGKEKPSVIQQRVCIWNDRNHEWCDSAVTHWMPLPAAPEGGNDHDAGR